MNQNYTKLIDGNDEFGKDSYLVHLNKVERLKDTLNEDFDMWSNFDNWESITVQRWIFARALDVYRGKKIYIECDCCKYIYSIASNFENIRRLEGQNVMEKKVHI